MRTVPEDIYKGMKVFDRAHHQIGRVEDFRFSENEDMPGIEPAELDEADRDRPETLMDAIAEAFGRDEIEEPLRSRLLREGYVLLDADGLFARDRYILPEQIDSASGDELVLNVEKDELVWRH